MTLGFIIAAAGNSWILMSDIIFLAPYALVHCKNRRMSRDPYGDKVEKLLKWRLPLIVDENSFKPLYKDCCDFIYSNDSNLLIHRFVRGEFYIITIFLLHHFYMILKCELPEFTRNPWRAWTCGS